jgi:rubrerythrin
METLKEKFLTVCQGCDGTGEYEEPIGGFENSVTYKLTKCDCEDGKELDWQKIDSEIKDIKGLIKLCEDGINTYLELAKNYTIEKNKSLLFSAMEKYIAFEAELLKLENYLEQLETIE